MTKVQVPLRLCLAGGGTDLPAHWRRHSGFVVSATINCHLTITIEPGNRLNVAPQDRYAAAAGWKNRDLVTAVSDVPPGSGLGGSGALMVGLLKARQPDLPAHELAAAAYNLERYHLGHPCGLQDHYAAALGGAITIEIDHDGTVTTGPVLLPAGFENRLLLMATGIQRDADQVLSAQQTALSGTLSAEESMVEIHRLGNLIWRDLVTNRGLEFGPLTRRHWEAKRATTGAVTNPAIDAWIDLAIQEGAEAGKCVGAGAGGFLLFVVPSERRQHVARVMIEAGLMETPFQFVDHGAQLL